MVSQISNRRILVVEDNRKLLSEIAQHFRDKNNVVFTADNLAAAKVLYTTEEVDAVILDVILPDGSGLGLLSINKDTPPPIIVLSDLDGDEDILSGLARGAADYVTKPCSMQVLEARVAIRLLPQKDARIESYGLTVDANFRTVNYLGRGISLTSSEFNLLYFLIKHSGVYFIASDLYERVWGAPSLQTTTVRRHLSTLRRKLKEVAPDKNLILTEFGKGYSFPKNSEA